MDNLTVDQNSFETKYMTDNNARFTRTEGGFVSVEFESVTYPRVDFCRAFPFTAPDLFISVREPGGKHREIGVIADMNLLERDTRAMINEQIELRYFTPKIDRVYSVIDANGVTTFDCGTDKGRCTFAIRGGSDAVIRLSDTRLIFTDIDGNRFEVADVTKLSRREQKKLDLYI